VLEFDVTFFFFFCPPDYWQALSILSSVLKWYKVASMVFVKAILIPLFMGTVLNVVTLKTCNTTLGERVLRCQQVSGDFALHWLGK
jgi:hypothetical protein